MKYTLTLENDGIELWGFGIRLDDDEARRVIRHVAEHFGADSRTVEVLRQVAVILGTHDGDRMSSAPHRAAGVARAELARLGVHEQELHTRRVTAYGVAS